MKMCAERELIVLIINMHNAKCNECIYEYIKYTYVYICVYMYLCMYVYIYNFIFYDFISFYLF